MQNARKIFILLVLGLLIIPWFSLPQSNIHGVEGKAPKPSFSWNVYLSCDYQKKLELWWNRSFGSRNTMLIAKNTIYDRLNFGQFHSGYWGNVLQGRHGVLFEKGYILGKYKNYSQSQIDSLAADTVTSLEKLKNELKKLGIHFALIIAPSKADCRPDDLPWLWQYRAKYIETPPSAYPIWEKHLKGQNITFVNGYDVIQKAGKLHDSFPDQGTHWSMLGAGLTWQRLSHILHDAEPLRFYPVEIENVKRTSSPRYAEYDIANLLNIRPKYSRGKKDWPEVFYKKFPVEKSASVISLGDSFSGQISPSIVKSGFSYKIWGRQNWMPSKQEWVNAIKHTDVVILTYTYPKLFSNRIKTEVDKLLSYSKGLILDRGIKRNIPYVFTSKDASGIFMLCNGWSGQESWGTWSNAKKVMLVFHVDKDLPTHLTMAVNVFLAKKHNAQRMLPSLNGIPLENIPLCKKQETITLDISKAVKLGFNRLIIELPDAISPKELGVNGDVRTLGIGLKNLSFKTVDKNSQQN